MKINLQDQIINWGVISEQKLNEVYNEYVKYQIESNDQIAKLINVDINELTYTKLFEESDELDAKYSRSMVLLDMDQLHPDQGIRDICNELNKKLSIFGIEQSMRKDVYKVYERYYNERYSKEKDNLSEEQNKFVEKIMIGYKMKGLHLEESVQDKIKELSKIISEKAIDYQQNLSNIKTELIFDLEELDGLDKNWIDNRINPNNNSQIIVKLQYPDYVPIMEYCTNRKTRETMYVAMGSRCIDSNVDLCLDVIKLRKEKSELFGFDSHSNYKLQNQMAKNYQNVMKFLNGLKEKISPIVITDLEKLTEISKQDQIEKIEIHDISYYSRLYTEKVSELNMKDLEKLFSIDSVVNGVLYIYSHLLKLQFVNVTNEHADKMYHPDVSMYLVYDLDDSTHSNPLGYFYLDLFPREGKYSHAAVFPLIRKSKYNLPVAAIVCNFDPKSDVQFDNVVTFFHEFGHLMHNMCSTNLIESLAGTQVERDFVETPSQMFEEWVYNYEPLQILVKPECKDQVTTELVSKINTQNKTLQGLFNARQLSFGLLDMELHSTIIPSDPKQYYISLYKELTGLDLPDSTNILGSFSHIIGGYDSGYYGYLWSKVFAIDLFSKFKDNILDQKLGLELRNKILAVGGVKSGYEMMEDFLQRKPDSDAFIKWLID